MNFGSTPARPQETSRPIGLIPFRSAHSAEEMTMAAAPSPIPDALPAVTVPPSRK